MQEGGEPRTLRGRLPLRRARARRAHGDLALAFAGKRGEKFAGTEWAPGLAGGRPKVAPIFECRTWARYPGGDHTIIVGEVLEWMTRPGDPLLFHSGELRGLPPARKRVSKPPRDA